MNIETRLTKDEARVLAAVFLESYVTNNGDGKRDFSVTLYEMTRDFILFEKLPDTRLIPHGTLLKLSRNKMYGYDIKSVKGIKEKISKAMEI